MVKVAIKDPELVFPEIVGQQAAKKKLTLFLENWEGTRILPHILLVSEKGSGKTMLSRALSKHLTLSGSNPPQPRHFLEITCSSLTNIRQFLAQIYLPKMMGREITLFFDEAHQIPAKLSNDLLTILNPNKDNRTTYTLDGTPYDFDFKLHTFIFATTESQKLFPPLADRMERVELEDYSHAELAQIVKRNVKGRIEDDVLAEISRIVRGNARSAQKMGNNINNYLIAHNKRVMSQAEWKYFKDRLSILPLGVNPIELKILQVLDKREEASLTMLSSITGMSREQLQRDAEMFLLRNKLMEIGTRGRKITFEGREYLKQIKL
jgi:Holliday junction resolvasome RuvABC ATP-dependent DNA helicase subunit